MILKVNIIKPDMNKELEIIKLKLTQFKTDDDFNSIIGKSDESKQTDLQLLDIDIEEALKEIPDEFYMSTINLHDVVHSFESDNRKYTVVILAQYGEVTLDIKFTDFLDIYFEFITTNNIFQIKGSY